MKCVQARRLFGAFWDDDATQAEREWIESHFVSCPSCRREYEEFSRVLELAGSLPRVEASPDLLERTLARTRRSVAVPDHIPSSGVRWIPVTAAAALLLVLGALVSPWVGIHPDNRVANRAPQTSAVRVPELVQPERVSVGVDRSPGHVSTAPVGPPEVVNHEALALGSDSLFDHSEDVEFILDPVTLRRGRASMTRPPAAVQGEQAVITF
jgi:anti-sigma factor RsiW